MTEVQFPRYREYVAARVEANNAMLALLAGTRLASHSLQLTAGSPLFLPQIFPGIRDIQRFNLRTDAAREILADADAHLVAVAVPYALAVHEDFVVSALDMLKANGMKIQSRGKAVRAWNMHESFYRTVGLAAPVVAMEQFHVLREMRNSQIHASGLAGTHLLSAISNMSAVAADGWERVTGQSRSDIVQAGQVKFVTGHLYASFAVTKSLGRAINSALFTSLPIAEWARVAAVDWGLVTKDAKNSTHWLRGMRGYVRSNYRSISFSETDLESGARAAGLWTKSNWS